MSLLFVEERDQVVVGINNFFGVFGHHRVQRLHNQASGLFFCTLYTYYVVVRIYQSKAFSRFIRSCTPVAVSVLSLSLSLTLFLRTLDHDLLGGFMCLHQLLSQMS